jgi:SAM-dependent methyltransferase
MADHINMTAYDGVEDLSRFSEVSFKSYCNTKLASCDKYIKFIRDNFPNKRLRVLEIGSGNGKLLLRLEKEGLLEYGVGFELSKSRCIFAEKFSKYLDSKIVKFYNKDYVVTELQNEKFDLIIGIDVVINMIGAISPQHINLVFDKAIKQLTSDGILLLEYMSLNREINFINNSENGFYRTWKSFATSDPFKYGLDEVSRDENGNLLWNKYFISRDTIKEEKSSSVWMPLNKDDFNTLASKYEMACSFFDFWDIFDDTLEEENVVLLKKVNN